MNCYKIIRLVKGEAGGIESLCRDYANYSNNKNVFAFLRA